jgi:serine protease Do
MLAVRTLTVRLLPVVAALSLAACAGKGAGARPGSGGLSAAEATPAAAQRPTPLSPAEVAEKAKNSIVLIRTPSGLGTGFVAAPGRVVTNFHVIARAEEATVETPDGQKYPQPIVLAHDKEHDLAVLKVPVNLPVLPLGDSDSSRPGDKIVAIGHPLGLGNTVSDGLVSAIRRVSPQLVLLQISAPISPGSSGGPLFNDSGQVVGVATLFGRRGQNLNFGVPVNYVKPLLLSENGLSLKALAQQQGARPARANLPLVPKRDVPTHPVSMLADCAADQIHLTADTIRSAIDVGAPLYNQGNIAGCAWVYEGAARDLTRRLRGCAGVRRALNKGLTRAAGVSTHVAHAWAMRDTFDGLADVISKKLNPGGGNSGGN